MDKRIDPRILKFLEEAPIFFRPWWLEAVSPGRWDYAVVYRGEDVAAVLPYAYKVRLKKFLLIEMPPLTPYLGPWLRKSSAKYANQLGEQKELMTELIEQLPKYSVFNQHFHHSITNWLPFYWKGFKQTTRYTFALDLNSDLKKIWGMFLDKVKTDVRKAESFLSISCNDDLETFIKLHNLTFNRQNKVLPYQKTTLEKLHQAIRLNNAGKIIFASDKEGNAHAAVYLIWDKDTVYYLLSGADPSLRNSGATSLLVWEGIKIASEMSKNFDFEGSVVESIERFVRGFGGTIIPYYEVSKNNSRIVTLYRKLWKTIFVQK